MDYIKIIREERKELLFALASLFLTYGSGTVILSTNKERWGVTI